MTTLWEKQENQRRLVEKEQTERYKRHQESLLQREKMRENALPRLRIAFLKYLEEGYSHFGVFYDIAYLDGFKDLNCSRAEAQRKLVENFEAEIEPGLTVWIEEKEFIEPIYICFKKRYTVEHLCWKVSPTK